MIKTFKDKDTADFFAGKRVKRFEAFASVANRKLRMLHRAEVVTDLKEPTGNQLEALKRDRIGQHSIRINRQYRICFVFADDGVYDVEIVDYH